LKLCGDEPVIADVGSSSGGEPEIARVVITENSVSLTRNVYAAFRRREG